MIQISKQNKKYGIKQIQSNYLIKSTTPHWKILTRLSLTRQRDAQKMLCYYIIIIALIYDQHYHSRQEEIPAH